MEEKVTAKRGKRFDRRIGRAAVCEDDFYGISDT